MTKTVKLVEIKGDTSVYIEAEITNEGDLQISGQDVGKLPEELFGDSDYEYWLTIKAADKDRVLLALIEKVYAGNHRLISAFKKLLDSKGISYKFDNYM